MLTRHYDNLLTHHYHVTCHFCLDTARKRKNIFAQLPCHSQNSESDRNALLYQRDQQKKNEEISLTRNGLTNLPLAIKAAQV